MKTTSLKRSKNKNGVTSNRTLLVIFVCVIVAATEWFFPSVLFRFVYIVSIPFTSVRDFLGGQISYVGEFFSSKASLSTENAELKKDLSSIDVRLLSMEALETENQSLQNMVATKQPTNAPKTSQTVFATVTERPPFSPYDTLTISSGGNSGITIGNPVFSDNGTPIGVVENVFPSSAKIILFSNPEATVPVVVGEHKFEATAEGKGGGNFSMKIPAGSAPKEGDAVYIPEFSPAALGVVENISVLPTDAFANVVFSYPENIFQMSFVTVETSRHFQITIAADEATTTHQ